MTHTSVDRTDGYSTLSLDNLTCSCLPVWIHSMYTFEVYFALIHDFLVQYGHGVLA